MSDLDMMQQTEIVTSYETIMHIIWQRVQPTLGHTATITLMERALALTEAQFSLVGAVTFHNDGLSFQNIAVQTDYAELQAAFETLLHHTFDLLQRLTGNILIRDMLHEIEPFRHV